MKHSIIICVVFIASFLGNIQTQSIHDETCNKIQKQGVASCLDQSTLGFCMQVGGEWRAIEAAKCDSRLCCDAKAMGCTLHADCNDVSSTTSTTSTVKPQVRCTVGNLRKHESDCKRFYYCSRNVWVESACTTGVFDENRNSCVFGECSSS